MPDADREKMLGVLGGMGPLASAQFMLRLTLLTPAARDQDHIPAVLWSDPRVPDRTRGHLAGGEDPLPWLLRGIAALKRAGCGAIAIPCNTAHGWFDAMQEAAGVPILHIVDAAAAELRRAGIGPATIGVMGTQATLDMRLYQDRLQSQGWDCIIPTRDEMAATGFAGHRTGQGEPRGRGLCPAGRGGEPPRGARRHGGGAGLHRNSRWASRPDRRTALRVPVIDTIDALARAAIAWARG